MTLNGKFVTSSTIFSCEEAALEVHMSLCVSVCLFTKLKFNLWIEECNVEECTGTDITSERNVQWTDITCETNVIGTNTTSEGKYRGQKAVCKIQITLMDITSHCLLSSSQEPSKCLFMFQKITFSM